MTVAPDLAAIRGREAAATQGPWHNEHEGEGPCVSVGDYGWVCSGPNWPAYDVDSDQGQADAEFIAHARTDVPALLATLTTALRLVWDMTDDGECWLDHHGGCQAHAYLSLGPGEKCPHAEAKELLAQPGIKAWLEGQPGS